MRIHVTALALASVLLTAGAASAQQNPLVTYCQADIERLCKGVPPGDGRLLACLQNHGQQISVGCAKALQAMKKNM